MSAERTHKHKKIQILPSCETHKKVNTVRQHRATLFESGRVSTHE